MLMCMESELRCGSLLYLIASEQGRYSCMQKLRTAQAVLSLYGMLECKLCCCCQRGMSCMREAVEWVVVSALLMRSYAFI